MWQVNELLTAKTGNLRSSDGMTRMDKIRNTDIGGIMAVEDTPHGYATLQYLDAGVLLWSRPKNDR
jgi:hypothetical protein